MKAAPEVVSKINGLEDGKNEATRKCGLQLCPYRRQHECLERFNLMVGGGLMNCTPAPLGSCTKCAATVNLALVVQGRWSHHDG
jgi:hypothetical protein